MKNQQLRGSSDIEPSADKKRPTLQSESDFRSRLLEVIGEEPVSAFSRRCGAGESLLRGYLKQGNKPGLDHLVAIADAANVSIEWLAAGRGPKQRGAALAAVAPAPAAAPPVVFDDLERLSTAIAAVEEGMSSIKRTLPPKKHAQLIAAAYGLLTEEDSSAKVIQFIKLAA